MVDCIAFRAKRHSTVVEFAKYSSAPVINALTDEAHPCQALADMLTIKEEFGSFEDVKIAWVGDSNNVAASLVEASAMLGCKIAISSPKGYEFSQAEIDKLTAQRQPGFTLAQIEDPREAVRGARVVYTDVWVSMGQEKEEQERVAAFKPYQVNAELMGLARTDAIFLHCWRRKNSSTWGCVGVPQKQMIKIMRKVRPGCRIIINYAKKIKKY